MPSSLYFKHPGPFGFTLYVVEDFFFFSKGSDGDFYLRGLQIVIAGLFSFWGGCVLFGALNFPPPVQKMDGKDWEG